MAVERSDSHQRGPAGWSLVCTHLEVSLLSLGGCPMASTFTVSSIVYSPSIRTMQPSVNNPSPGTWA